MLFLHFATPKWELQIMFAMSHLRCGTRVQLPLCRVPSSAAVLPGLGWKLWPFLSGHPFKISSKMAACINRAF